MRSSGQNPPRSGGTWCCWHGKSEQVSRVRRREKEGLWAQEGDLVWSRPFASPRGSHILLLEKEPV